METKELIEIVKKRIKYLKGCMNLTRKAIIRAQTNKDFESAIANIRSYDNESYALFELKRLETDIEEKGGLNSSQP